MYLLITFIHITFHHKKIHEKYYDKQSLHVEEIGNIFTLPEF